MTRPHRRRFLELAAGAAALSAVPGGAWAQAYPTRPVRLIAGFAAGGGTDITARLTGQWLSERLGQPFIVENRPGAGSSLGAELVVNDHWEIAIDSGADWVHLGQGDLDEADVLAVRKAGIKLGISTHDDAELVRALTFAPDYVALGPIYPTKLKAMAFAPQGLETIGVWKRRIGAIPLVAIGGLDVERAKLCLAAGADIVSVVTDITLNADPEARAREWIAATRPA